MFSARNVWPACSNSTCLRPLRSSDPHVGFSRSPFGTKGAFTPAAITDTRNAALGQTGTSGKGGSRADGVVATAARTTAAATAMSAGTGNPRAPACIPGATAIHELDGLSVKGTSVLFHVIQCSEWFREIACIEFDINDILACVSNVVCAVSFNTLKSYLCHLSTFFDWFEKKRGHLPVFPFSQHDIAMFLLSRVQSLRTVSSLSVVFSALKWAHSLYGDDSVFSSKFLHFFLRGLQRGVAKPTSKKKPITRAIVEKIVKMFAHDDSNLCHLRTALIFLMGFVGFLRISEILDIKIKDLFFHPNFDYLKIIIPKTKTDQLRTGNCVYIAAAANELCTVNLLCRYLVAAGNEYDPEAYLFQTIIHKKSTKTYQLKGKKMSYSCARKSIKQALTSVGESAAVFGTHSLRAGAPLLQPQQGLVGN